MSFPIKRVMKKLSILSLLIVIASFFACNDKDDGLSDRYKWLTGTTWASDSLLLNGQDAGAPGQALYNFRGDAIFRTDGTGVFGKYQGTWRFAMSETELVIESDSLILPLSARIVELTQASLKITTAYPNLADPSQPLNIRMTFRSK